MAPIRVGIVGLSSNSGSGWAPNAHLPYFLSPLGRSKYQITALLNTSVDSAKRAIKEYNLDAETKAYGNAEDLANDPDVDLVIVSVRVDWHYETALPSVKAGKDVYVEWPLAQDAQHARSLAEAAKRAGGKTIVGIQGRTAPIYLKISELLSQGRIGKVLSSDVKAAGGLNDRIAIPASLKYFTDKSVGGNVFTIGFAHLFDQIQHVLGDATDLQSRTQIQRPNVEIKDPKTQKTIETVKSDTPDLIITTGTLPASEIVAEGATLLVRYRKGQPFKGEPALVWTINGEKGEIRLTSDSSTALAVIADPESVRIEVHDFEKDEVEQVAWDWSEWQVELPAPARTIGAVFEAFAKGEREHLATFEDAVERHEQLEKISPLSG